MADIDDLHARIKALSTADKLHLAAALLTENRVETAKAVAERAVFEMSMEQVAERVVKRDG